MTSPGGRSVRGTAATSLSLLLASCATGALRPTAVAPTFADRQEVTAGPGAVAWSPDGNTLAVVRTGGVVLLDLRGQGSRSISGSGAIAVDWAPATSLLVVERDASGGRVIAVDPGTGTRRVLHAGPPLVAARWLHAGAGWLAVAETRQIGAYGTHVTLTLTASLGDAPGELYRSTAVLPTKDPSADVVRGWAAARPNPVDHGLLLPVFRKAPLFPAHVQLVTLDPFDPEPQEAGRLDVQGWTAASSWSSDGRRAAVAAADGTLRMVEGGAPLLAPPGAVRGLHPSWQPGGELIFLGGWLVTPAGDPVRQLVAHARDAVGFWSPSGERLAVAVGDALFLFGDLATPGGQAEAERRRVAARAALWELGTLRSEGLVAPAVYRERRHRLRGRGTESP